MSCVTHRIVRPELAAGSGDAATSQDYTYISITAHSQIKPECVDESGYLLIPKECLHAHLHRRLAPTWETIHIVTRWSHASSMSCLEYSTISSLSMSTQDSVLV